MKKKSISLYFIMILFVAIVLRVAFLGDLPGKGALNQDEAYAGYNAWALLHYGVDDAGYHNPVYFVAWGSGMNVLESYCMIPFIKVLGLNPLSIRLPAAVLGIITVVAFYYLIRYGTKDYNLARLGLIMIAINPWNVMISRWGLESNFLPGFVLLGSLFLVKSMEIPAYFIISMLFYGLSLYAYSAAWVIMPFIIAFSIVFLFKKEGMKVSKYHFVGGGVLLLLAIPLLVFVLVNIGMIDEVRTAFLSIPRMKTFRGSEVDIRNLFRNARRLFRVLVLQEDKYSWNAIPPIGIYYYCSIPFMLIGFVEEISRIKNKMVNRVDGLMIIQFIMGIILALQIEGNINRVNIIHIPVIYFICIGIKALYSIAKEKARETLYLAITIVMYTVFFFGFIKAYCIEYNEKFAYKFMDGLNEALDYATDKRPNDVIHILDTEYPNVLYALEYSPVAFLEQVLWAEDIAAFRDPLLFGDVWFHDYYEDTLEEADGIYICKNDNINAISYMEYCDMEIYEFGYCVLGIK